MKRLFGFYAGMSTPEVYHDSVVIDWAIRPGQMYLESDPRDASNGKRIIVALDPMHALIYNDVTEWYADFLTRLATAKKRDINVHLAFVTRAAIA